LLDFHTPPVFEAPVNGDPDSGASWTDGETDRLSINITASTLNSSIVSHE